MAITNFPEKIDSEINLIDDINEKGLSEYEKKKKVVMMCLDVDESWNFRNLKSTIDDLSEKDFLNLFEGNTEYNYKISNKNFQELVIKFENFQAILPIWYEDEDSHEYLKKLWEKYPSIEHLREKSLEELEQEESLKEIDFIKWNIKYKKQFRKLINESLDYKAGEIYTFLKNDYFYLDSLIASALVCKDKLKYSSCDEKGYYNSNIEKITNKITHSICEKYSKVKIDNNKPTSGMIIKTKKKLIEYYSRANSTLRGFNTLLPLFQNQKLRESIILISKTKDFLDGPILDYFNITLNLLELTSSVFSLYEEFEIYRKNQNAFTEALEEIKNNFKTHKNEIGILPDNTDLALDKIIDVAIKITEDRQNLLDLIDVLNNIIEEEKEKKKKNTNKIIFRALTIIASGIGVIATGGGAAIIWTASGIICGGDFIIKLKKNKKIKQNIKGYKNTLEKAKSQELIIRYELENVIKELYRERKSENLPYHIKKIVFDENKTYEY